MEFLLLISTGVVVPPRSFWQRSYFALVKKVYWKETELIFKSSCYDYQLYDINKLSSLPSLSLSFLLWKMVTIMIRTSQGCFDV